MRIDTASLMLTARIAIGVASILATSGLVGAEPITVLSLERTPKLTANMSQLPEYLDGLALSPANDEGSGNEATVAKSAPGWPIPHRRWPRAGKADNAERAEDSVFSLNMTAPQTEDWSWNRDFKEALRPLYDELVDAGMIDAVASLKSYLSLTTVSADARRAAEHGATSESAWSGTAANPLDANHQRRSAAQIEREQQIATSVIEGFVEAVKPWLFGLAALYALWHLTRLGFDFSHWRSTRARKRRSRRTRGHRHQPTTAERVKAVRPRLGHWTR